MADIASSASTVVNRAASGNFTIVTCDYAMTTAASAIDTVSVPGLRQVIGFAGPPVFRSSAATSAFSVVALNSSITTAATIRLNTPTTHNNFSVRYTVFGR